MNNVAYNPSSAEIALAQGWATPNGYGTILTPWTLDTDSLSFTTPTSGGGGVIRFGFGSGVFASIAAPQGSLTGAGSGSPAAQPVAPATLAAAVTPVSTGLLSSPLVLIGLGVGVWYFFLRGKR